MEIKEFTISDESLTRFRRSHPKPNDCVINALEILGILETHSADITRIFVGDDGLLQHQIEKVFEITYPGKKWDFTPLHI